MVRGSRIGQDCDKYYYALVPHCLQNRPVERADAAALIYTSLRLSTLAMEEENWQAKPEWLWS